MLQEALGHRNRTSRWKVPGENVVATGEELATLCCESVPPAPDTLSFLGSPFPGSPFSPHEPLFRLQEWGGPSPLSLLQED